MKKSILLISLTVLSISVFTAFAAEEMKTHDMRMEHSGHMGKIIRETNIGGYHLSYHLIDMRATMKDMKGIQPGMQEKDSHHLMLYIQDAKGNNINSAQVGYLIVRPDGTKQKVMTMGMSDAYGADIHLSQPGEYTIKCKAVVGEKKLLDEFKYKNG